MLVKGRRLIKLDGFFNVVGMGFSFPKNVQVELMGAEIRSSGPFLVIFVDHVQDRSTIYCSTSSEDQSQLLVSMVLFPDPPNNLLILDTLMNLWKNNPLPLAWASIVVVRLLIRNLLLHMLKLGKIALIIYILLIFDDVTHWSQSLRVCPLLTS